MGAGLFAGIPQVLAAQGAARLLGLPRQRADIGPRFVQRLAQHLGVSLPTGYQWALATAFHFGYSAWWGGLYAAVQEVRPMRPLVGGPLLAALIYSVAFSPWGAATQNGAERPPDRRPEREPLLHWTAALSFSLTAAYCCTSRLRSAAPLGRPVRVGHRGPRLAETANSSGVTQRT
jgi:hypothetical protein